MKKLIFIIAILSTTVNAQEGLKDSWSYGKDKQKHELVGFGMGVFGTTYMIDNNVNYWRAALRTTVASTLPIVGKEIYDYNFKQNGLFSYQDIAWSYYGVAEGTFGTALTYKMSDLMLKMSRHGKRDSYVVPAMFFGSGSAFLSEVFRFILIDNYRPQPLNFSIKSISYTIQMIVKNKRDKKKGKHKYFEEKFKL